MRIFPSQSAVMNRNVGSTASFTMVASNPVMLDQRRPVVHGRAAERIDADFHAGGFDQRHVDGIAEIGDIGADIVVQMRRGRLAGARIRHPRHALHVGFHVGVGGLFDLGGHVGIGRAAMRRVVFVAAILGRIVRGRDDDAIGKPAGAALVVAQDRMRDDRRRRIAAALVDHDVDAVGGKYLHRARQRRLGQRMGIDADEQRAGQPGLAAVVADRLRRRQDMVFVERVLQRRPAMPRGSEGDALGGIGRIGFAGEIRRDQPRHIDEGGGIDRFAGGGIGGSHMTSRDGWFTGLYGGSAAAWAKIEHGVTGASRSAGSVNAALPRQFRWQPCAKYGLVRHCAARPDADAAHCASEVKLQSIKPPSMP